MYVTPNASPKSISQEIEDVDSASERPINSQSSVQVPSSTGCGESKESSSGDAVISPETVAEETGASGISDNTEITGEGASTIIATGTSRETLVGADSGSTTESSNEIANRGCCLENQGIIWYFRISMMYLRDSVYLLPFQFILLALPVSSGFMGAKYMERCPASPAIPLIFFMMGILGTIIICSRIYFIFKMALFPQASWSEQIRSGLVSAVVMLIILYVSELACFFTASPSFKHGNDNYCDETFFSFVYYANYISLTLVVLLTLLHCPGSHLCSSIDTPHILYD